MHDKSLLFNTGVNALEQNSHTASISNYTSFSVLFFWIWSSF